MFNEIDVTILRGLSTFLSPILTVTALCNTGKTGDIFQLVVDEFNMNSLKIEQIWQILVKMRRLILIMANFGLISDKLRFKMKENILNLNLKMYYIGTKIN